MSSLYTAFSPSHSPSFILKKVIPRPPWYVPTSVLLGFYQVSQCPAVQPGLSMFLPQQSGVILSHCLPLTSLSTHCPPPRGPLGPPLCPHSGPCPCRLFALVFGPRYLIRSVPTPYKCLSSVALRKLLPPPTSKVLTAVLGAGEPDLGLVGRGQSSGPGAWEGQQGS